MREIKFRAWNISEKRWCSPAELEWCLLPNPYTHGDGVFEIDESNKEKDSAFNLGTSYELMQYTGLKDKNGKEIYEGDIINTYLEDEQGPLPLSEVCFFEGCFVITESAPGYSPSYYWEKGELTLREFAKDSEIVGNIYENPELLQGGTE